ncbi:MAG: HAMP domain-containing histidine kinase [Actinomycetota bacterium]|nr:HAMP domain-containing histidine kinase [Actinomycetota bacterium]
MRRGRAIGRLPIRWRVSLAFTCVLAVVLVATGLFLDLRFAAEMNHAVDQSLRSRAGDVIALVRQADSGLRTAGHIGPNTTGGGFAQILTLDGAIFDSSPQTSRQAVLSRREVSAVRASGQFFDRSSVAGLQGPVRILAIRTHAQGSDLVVTVGATLSEGERALGSLRALLLTGGAGALILCALAGYLAVAGALRPIESMRRRAEEITAAEPGPRLPVAQANDEVARLGGTLNSMLDRLEDALRHERTFVADASHELRGPLAILKAELELAQRDPQTREALERTIRSASEETDRLAQLTEDLLVIARGEQGQLAVNVTRVDTDQLLRDVRDRFATSPHVAARNILISSIQRGHLQADAATIDRALGNLVENALRYGDGDVTLAAISRDGTIELHVCDEGRGFEPEFLPDAFRRFARADPGRSTDGAGLGLAIVAAIAASHGGAAHAANRPRGGADVWISLPATE